MERSGYSEVVFHAENARKHEKGRESTLPSPLSNIHPHEVTGLSPVVRTRNDRKSKDFRSFSMHILDRIFCYIRVFSSLFQQICNFSETTFYQVRNKFETAFQPVLSEKWSKLLHLCCTYLPSKSTQRLADLLCRFFFAALMLIMCVDTQRHINGGVSGKVLYLFDIQSAFK